MINVRFDIKTQTVYDWLHDYKRVEAAEIKFLNQAEVVQAFLDALNQ